MGFNDHLEEYGYGSVDSYVCEDCVVDDALRATVKSNLSSRKCDYCNTISINEIAAPFNEVMDLIYQSIITEFADAQDIDMPWVEGGWLFGETEQYDVIGFFDPGWPGEFIEDISDSLGCDKYWVPHSDGDWSLNTPVSTLRYGWEKFKSQVINKTRYLFLSEPVDEISLGRPDHIPVSHMLDALGNLVNVFNLTETIPVGTPLFRVRVANDGKKFIKFEEVAAPPPEISGAGRLNPAGIPYLYLSFDIETAIRETVYRPVSGFAKAVFHTKQDLRVVNLTNVPSPPGMFEPHLYNERHELYFMRDFLKDISKPVQKDKREHVEYVPTQIISEFFRYRFKTENGEKILGIKYPSTKQNDGMNLALFVSKNDDAKEILELKDIQMR